MMMMVIRDDVIALVLIEGLEQVLIEIVDCRNYDNLFFSFRTRL